MTEQEIDILYEKVFTEMRYLGPKLANDFTRLSGPSVDIYIQALSDNYFSLRLVGNDGKPSYVYGNKELLLFCLRQKIRNIVESAPMLMPGQKNEDFLGEASKPPKSIEPDDLDVFFNLLGKAKP